MIWRATFSSGESLIDEGYMSAQWAVPNFQSNK